MSEAPMSVERAGGAAWCTLDRPPLNLLEPGLIHAVRATFDALAADRDRKSTRLNSSHSQISYAVFCLKKKKRHAEANHQIVPHSTREPERYRGGARAPRA